MSNYKLGFIGFGNMAKAIASGIINKKLLSNNDIIAYDPNINENDGVVIAKNNLEVVQCSDYIILAVKPNMVNTVLYEIKDVVNNKPIGSIAAGISTKEIAEILPDAHILRIMPNTCATVGESYTCLNSDNNLTEAEFGFYNDIFSAVGKVLSVKESYFNICTSVSSCGVAFGHMLVESMADGGVLCGMNKAQSVEMAAYAIMGACKMIIETGENPMVLKDKICSPGGMTAKAMKTLEDGNFRATVINAIEQAYLKGSNIK